MHKELTVVVAGLQGESTLRLGLELLYHKFLLPANATATDMASPVAMGCNCPHGFTTWFVSVYVVAVVALASSCTLPSQNPQHSSSPKPFFRTLQGRGIETRNLFTEYDT